jgi:hypothetical protein
MDQELHPLFHKKTEEEEVRAHGKSISKDAEEQRRKSRQLTGLSSGTQKQLT